MNHIKPTIFLKLPFVFDRNKLVAEVKTILGKKWIPHFNTGGYDGTWSSLALYAPDGNATNILAMQNNQTSLKETEVLKDTKYLKNVLRSFKAPFLSVRLLKLEIGAVIKPHRDYNLGYENGCFRLHIPIITHKNIEFILHDTCLNMLPGECWYTNVNYLHSVANRSPVDRIHLVIDLERNQWSDELFFSLAPKESFFIKPQEKYSRETQKRMLQELKRMNNPGAKELIKKIENEL